MSAMAERVQQDWEREAIDLKRQGLVSNDIAEAVGKSPSTVRKVIARAREAGDLPAEFAVVDPPKVPDLMKALEESLGRSAEEQTTVDDFIPPEDDPEYEAPERDLSGVALIDEDVDPLATFKEQAGPAVGDMPPETPPEPGETETVLPVLKGTRQMALDLGPNAAPVLQATVKFTSEKWPSGFFGMGDVVTGTFTARINSVPAKEEFDKDSEEFRAKPVAYGALITEIEYEAVVPDP